MTKHIIDQWPSAPAALPLALQEEFVARAGNGQVGSRLVSETEHVRVWLLSLKPGDLLPQILEESLEVLARLGGDEVVVLEAPHPPGEVGGEEVELDGALRHHVLGDLLATGVPTVQVLCVTKL